MQPIDKRYTTRGSPAYVRSRFCTSPEIDPADICARLKRDGVCVVPGLFTEAECSEHVDAIMKDLEVHVPGFKYQDQATWHILREKTKATHGLIIQQFGFGWLQSVVNVRTHPKIVSLFRDFWTVGVSKLDMEKGLLSSADALSVSLMPPALINAKRSKAGYHRDNANWLHWDRSPSDKLKSYQGLLNMKDVEKDLGSTFCFISGSHKRQAAFQAKFLQGKEKDENPRFYLLSKQEHFDFYRQEADYFALKLKAGDFLLWDSRLIHQGRPPVFDEKTSVPLERCAVYACYQPKKWATSKDVKKKRKAYQELRTTTHNASGSVELFSKKPRLYSKEEAKKMLEGGFAIPVTRPPSLSKEAKSLFALDT